MRNQPNSGIVAAFAAKLFFSCCLSMLLMGHITAQHLGCTDSLAINYDSLATQNNGSCMYSPELVSVLSSWDLPESMIETSGLIIWDERIWTHNDDTDINLYAFDTTDVQNYQAYPLTGTVNIDWEEISQDND